MTKKRNASRTHAAKDVAEGWGTVAKAFRAKMRKAARAYKKKLDRQKRIALRRNSKTRAVLKKIR